MIRRLNYTARRKIPRSRIRVALHGEDPGSRTFDASIDLAGLGFPDEAAVYVEAYYRHLYMRFPFGRIGRIQAPEDRRLTEMRGTELVQFRVKVVDESSDRGRLVGIASQVSPFDNESDEGRSILYFNAAELGDRIWRLRFDTEMPTLELNRLIPDARDRILSDPVMFTLVMPSVLREILAKVVLVESHDDADDDGEDWRSVWLRFACGTLGLRSVPPAEEGGSLDECEEWIEDAVDAFCSRHRVIERYLDALGEGGS